MRLQEFPCRLSTALFAFEGCKASPRGVATSYKGKGTMVVAIYHAGSQDVKAMAFLSDEQSFMRQWLGAGAKPSMIQLHDRPLRF